MQTNFRLTPAAKALLVLSTLSGLLVATPAVAAVDMFMQIPGVVGESTDKNQKDNIDVLAWSWGASNSGAGGGAGLGKASFQDLSWTQYIDSSIPPLFLGLARGTHFDHATLSVRHRGDSPFVFLTIRFDDVLISSLSMGGSSGEDRLTTNVSMSPLEMITLTYTPRSVKGGAGEPIVAKWDLKKQEGTGFSGDPEAVFGLFLAGQTLNLNGLPLTPVVPEPQTWLMFGLGLAGVAAWHRRRKGASATGALLPA